MKENKAAAVEAEERPKHKAFEKIKRVISSVVIAIVVWFVTINVVNPEITVTISDAPVRFVGENALREKGLVLVEREKLPSFSLKVRGTRREILDGMDKIRVEIDLSSISDQGEIISYPTVSLPASVSLEKQKFSSVELCIEPNYKKEIPIVINQTSTEKTKDTIVESVPEVNQLQISGSKSELGEAQYCLVSIDTSSVMQSGKTMYSYQICNGEKVPLAHNSTIYTSYATIPVNNTIYKRYTAEVKVKASAELEKHYAVEIDAKSVSPTTVDIGLPDGAQAPKYVEALFKDGDYKSGIGDFTAEPADVEGLYIPQQEIKFRANVMNRITVTAPVAVEVINIPQGLAVEVNPVTVNMQLSVPEGEETDIKAQADASGCTEGEYNLNVKFENEHIVNIGNSKIHVMLKNK